jgi:predicted NBD/HSP70 family sugar kinase
VQTAKIAIIGIDLGKNSCSLAALDGNGAVIKRRRMRPGSPIKGMGERREVGL